MNDFDGLKARISPGDMVSFLYKREQVDGRVVSLGRARAVVRCGHGRQYRVPYDRIRTRGPATDHSGTERDAVDRCEELMKAHGLAAKGWVARLDDSRSRAGACDYSKKRILLSRLYVRVVGRSELDDTILHEIAHALVGPHHHHDAVWRAKARAIGCSGDRCHTLRFSPPRWIVACQGGCFSRPAHRRRRHAVCRRCGGPLAWRGWDGTPEHERSVVRNANQPAREASRQPDWFPVIGTVSSPTQGEFDFGTV